ncbi:TetR/AcrR family transcriptional regulator [Promicromonospora thailandica]|uniref:Transcriptional regulator, TetR family n=1 Tax=Promicromonospora thailandica TaxID=765201 RepID=A0A9X2G088_9MICO|nr:TetR/AcrR family transcriptional regulator [Promicromonospora thailandica]MCP2262857.1 transcriptional regulator, TetR family [Promicromonospora thailandica]BFF18194.1 helix-turn-helix domain-containing protein [Promicromonospora thailandica]
MPRPRIADRRGRILDAARELVLDRGWADVTVADVAARAGIGKGAVYLEFADKAAILAGVLTRSARALTAEVHARVLGSPGLVDLPAVYRFGVDALLGDPLMRALYLGDEGVLGRHVHDVADDRYLRRMGWLADYVTGLQRAGVLDPDVPAATVVRVLSLFTLGMVHAPGVLGATSAEDLSAAVDLFADLVGRGLAAGGPADPDAARAAQLALLESLDAQLGLLGPA